MPPKVQLMQLIFGKAVTQAVSVAARFRIADKLVDAPKTVNELATECGLNPGHLYRVMRALVGLQVFSCDESGQFGLTPMSNLLRSDVPGSARPIATYVCDPWSWQPWGDLADSVRSGRPVFDRVFGEGVFDYLGKHPDEAATFNEGMTGFTEQAATAILLAYDFSGFNVILDVGGGHGALLGAILKQTPKARGILFDTPQVETGAVDAIGRAGLSSRCRVECGNFFQSVPSGADLLVMKNIIHDWNDLKATAILRVCHKALESTAKLLLVELVVPPGFDPHMSHILDLEMMVLCDGKERTESEYRELLAGAGFRLERIIPTEESPYSLIEAVPV